MKKAEQTQLEADKLDDDLIIKACAKMDIFELRQYARIVGIADAENYGRKSLIDYILDIENGRKPIACKSEVLKSQKLYEPTTSECSATYEELIIENKKLKNCLKSLEQIIKNCLK